MGLLSSSIAQLAYVSESVWGTTPSNPVLKTLRYAPPAVFSGNAETIESGEMRADRNPTDSITVGRGAAGNLPFELSYGAYDDLFAGALCGSWDTNVLKNGTAVKSFTIERKIPTGEATADYFRYTGMRANTLSLSVRAREIVKGSFGFVGKAEAYSDALISGATYAEAATEDVLNATSDFASLGVGTLSGIHVLGIEMNVDNGLTSHYAVGAMDPIGVAFGLFRVSGRMEIYYESADLYEAYLAETPLSLAFTVGNTTAEKYTVTIPKLKCTTGELSLPGSTDPIMVNVEWSALYDSVEECSMKIARAVA